MPSLKAPILNSGPLVSRRIGKGRAAALWHHAKEHIHRAVCELGGGGHATIAGAQMQTMNKEDVIKELKKAINEYNTESN